MNIIQTFYSYCNMNNPVMDNAGFLSPDMNWKSMAISCLLLKKHFGNVTLYCNERVRTLVMDQLKIPYDNIIVIPDFMENYKGCNLWALPKVYTYSLQRNPFLHVDCDWFMFEKLPDSILKSDIIGQNIEYDDQMYNHCTLEKLISNGCELPELALREFKKEPILRVVNAGILGGNNIKFIQLYLRMIKRFISANKSLLHILNDGFVNSIYEQFFFYLLAKHEKQTLGLCTPGDKLSTRFDWLPMDLIHSPKSGYMHLLANLKRRMNTYVFVNQYLNHLDKDLGYRITKICQDNGVSPLINFPQWGIYNNEPSNMVHLCEKDSKRKLMNDSSGIYNLNTSYLDLYKDLQLHAETIADIRDSSRDMLWSINSLWNTKHSLSISENIRISKISSEQALLNLKGNDISKLNGNEIVYLTDIPDPMLMKVVSTLIYGIKVDVIDHILSVKQDTLNGIANYLEQKSHVRFDSTQAKIALDRTIRSMIVSGILKLNS